MKLLVGREADELIAALTELSREPQKEAEVWFEVNPTTMI
jgi:primosomal protein N' (replication factor Y)